MSRQDVVLRFTLDGAELAKVKSGISSVESRIGKLLKVAAISAAPAALVLLTKRASETIDTLAKQADLLNVLPQSLKTYAVNADLAGVSNEQFSMGLRKMVTNIGAAINGTGAATAELKRLGINVQELAGLRADEQFERIAAKIMGLATQSERLNAASKIFGEDAGARMLNLIQSMGGAGGVTQAQLAAMNVTLSRFDAAKVEAGNDALTKAKLVSEGFANTLAVAVAPWVEEVGNRIFNAGVEAGNFRPQVEAAIAAVAKTLAFLADAAVAAANTIGTAFTVVGQTVGAGFAQLVAVARGEFELARQIGNQWYNDQIKNWEGLANNPDLTQYRDKIDEIIASIQAQRFEEGKGGAANTGKRPPGPVISPQEITALQALQAELRGVGDEEDKAAVRRARLTMLYQQGRISGEQYRYELTAMAGGYDSLASAQEKAAQGVTAFADQAARNIQDITAAFLRGESVGKSFFSSMIKGLADLASQVAAQQLLNSLFGGLSKSSNPFFAALGASFGGGRATGGDIDPGKFYLVGEREPELIAPRSAGTVIPLSKLGGGGSVRVTNHIDARGASPEMLPMLARMMRESEARTTAQIFMALKRRTAPV
jgi:hypothetical protein